MNILIVNNTKIPAIKYGGTERVIWGLGKALAEMGHSVSYMVAAGSACPFAREMLVYDPTKRFDIQVPDYIDVIHFNWVPPDMEITKPYIITLHGNINHACTMDLNTVFISADHARRHHGEVYVYNGLDWDNYSAPALDNIQRRYFHFLADASWKVKNVKGAIKITRQAHEKLEVLGGDRLNFNMGFRFTPDLHVRFRGRVDDVEKAKYVKASKGLIFPVLWHEPFGLAVIESLYLGCPVFATPYGSLTELVKKEVGFTSSSSSALSAALKDAGSYDRNTCHQYAADQFNARTMALNYLDKYEKVANGRPLHSKAPVITQEYLLQQKKYLDMLP